MIKNYKQFNEGYNEVDELTQLSDDLISIISNKGNDFFKEYKEDECVTIEQDLLCNIVNVNDYTILKDFINEFELYVEIANFKNEKFKGGFLPEDKDNYVNIGSLGLNIGIQSFNKNLTKNRAISNNPVTILYKTLTETFRSTIVHELQHIYDYFRSKSKFSKSKKTDRYNELIKDFEKTGDMSEEAEKLYNELTHEQWGRFSGAISEIDFSKDWNSILKEFKIKFRRFDVMSESDKKRLIKSLYKYYDKNKINESLKDKLVGPSKDELLNFLINKKLSPNELLYKSIEFELPKGIKLALERGADDTYQSPYDDLLLQSCKEGDLENVKLALEKGANVHCDQDKPLIFSSIKGYTEIVKLLLDNGAYVHMWQDYSLIWSSTKGYTDTVKVLLEYGADIHVNNDEPLRKSEQNGHTETVELLKKYMKKK